MASRFPSWLCHWFILPGICCAVGNYCSWLSFQFRLFNQRVRDRKNTGAVGAVVCLCRFGRRSSVSRLSITDTNARASGVAGRVPYFSSVRRGPPLQSACCPRRHVREYSTRGCMVGHCLSAHEELVASSGTALVMELGNGISSRAAR